MSVLRLFAGDVEITCSSTKGKDFGLELVNSGLINEFISLAVETYANEGDFVSNKDDANIDQVLKVLTSHDTKIEDIKNSILVIAKTMSKINANTIHEKAESLNLVNKDVESQISSKPVEYIGSDSFDEDTVHVKKEDVMSRKPIPKQSVNNNESLGSFSINLDMLNNLKADDTEAAAQPVKSREEIIATMRKMSGD